MNTYCKSFALSLMAILICYSVSMAQSSIGNLKQNLSTGGEVNQDVSVENTKSAVTNAEATAASSVEQDKVTAWELLADGFQNKEKSSLLKAIKLYEKLVNATGRSGKYLTYLARCYAELYKLDNSNTEYQQMSIDLFNEAAEKIKEQPDATGNVTLDGIKSLLSEVSKKAVDGNIISKYLDVARKYINNRAFHTAESWKITKHGDVSCAYYVSYVLKEAGVISNIEYGVDELIQTILDTNMYTKTPAPPYQTGDIILWSGTSHIGFIDEEGDSIDNSSSAGMPKKRGVWGSQEPYVLRLNS